jgi:hypothetical protein
MEEFDRTWKQSTPVHGEDNGNEEEILRESDGMRNSRMWKGRDTVVKETQKKNSYKLMRCY